MQCRAEQQLSATNGLLRDCTNLLHQSRSRHKSVEGGREALVVSVECFSVECIGHVAVIWIQINYMIRYMHDFLKGKLIYIQINTIT